MSETVRTDEAAALLGVSESRLRAILAEKGIRAVGREPGRSGKNLYLAARIRQLATIHTSKPGPRPQ